MRRDEREPERYAVWQLAVVVVSEKKKFTVVRLILNLQECFAKRISKASSLLNVVPRNKLLVSGEVSFFFANVVCNGIR